MQDSINVLGFGVSRLGSIIDFNDLAKFPPIDHGDVDEVPKATDDKQLNKAELTEHCCLHKDVSKMNNEEDTIVSLKTHLEKLTKNRLHETNGIVVRINHQDAEHGLSYKEKMCFNSESLEEEKHDIYLNIEPHKRNLSYTEAVSDNDRENQATFSILDDPDGEEKNGDDMNEMDMPNPGSIQHFERLFYPRIPCKNCSTCYQQFAGEIFFSSNK